MNILFNCTKCSQEMSVEEAAIGMEVDCPNCGENLTIPQGKPDPDSTSEEPSAENPETDKAKGGGGSAAAPSKDEPKKGEDPPKKLAVPIRPKNAPKEKLEEFDHKGVKSKAEREKEKEQKAGEKKESQICVKTIRRNQCLEMGHDNFDEVVGEFLRSIGQEAVISITTTTYSYFDSQGKSLGDYGVMIVYKG